MMIFYLILPFAYHRFLDLIMNSTISTTATSPMTIWSYNGTGSSVDHDNIFHRHYIWLAIIIVSSVICAILGYFIGCLKAKCIPGSYLSTTANTSDHSSGAQELSTQTKNRRGNQFSHVPQMPAGEIKSNNSRVPSTTKFKAPQTGEQQKSLQAKKSIGKGQLLQFLIQQRAERETNQSKRNSSSKVKSSSSKKSTEGTKSLAKDDQSKPKSKPTSGPKITVNPIFKAPSSIVGRTKTQGSDESIGFFKTAPEMQLKSNLDSFQTARSNASDPLDQQKKTPSTKSLTMLTAKESGFDDSQLSVKSSRMVARIKASK